MILSGLKVVRRSDFIMLHSLTSVSVRIGVEAFSTGFDIRRSERG